MNVRKAIMDKDIEAEMQVMDLAMVGNHAVARSQYLVWLARMLTHGAGLAERVMVHRDFPVDSRSTVVLQAAHSEQASMQCWLDANQNHLRDIEHGRFASCAVGRHMAHAFGIVFNNVKEIWAQLMTAYVQAVKDRFPSRALLEDPQLLATQELQKEFTYIRA